MNGVHAKKNSLGDDGLWGKAQSNLFNASASDRTQRTRGFGTHSSEIPPMNRATVAWAQVFSEGLVFVVPF